MSSTGRAVLIMMDSDVPRNGSRVPLLHWIAPDITGTTDGSNSSLLTLPPSDAGVPYQPPTPPQGDYPHRYSFLLYEQPRNFSIPSSVNASARVGFDLQNFLQVTGLSTGLAANYMLVANISGPAATSFPPAAFTASSTLASSEANITPTGSAAGGGSVSGSATATSGSGTAATASPTGEGSVLKAGSGVALLAAVFGVLLM
jgi:phosphatidylethanolamine-binding protein